MLRLTESERNHIIGYLSAGQELQTFALMINISRLTAHQLQQRFRQTGVTRDRPKSGNTNMTTQRQDGFIRTVHFRNRLQHA